jgi:hypothetical protein
VGAVLFKQELNEISKVTEELLVAKMDRHITMRIITVVDILLACLGLPSPRTVDL